MPGMCLEAVHTYLRLLCRLNLQVTLFLNQNSNDATRISPIN